MRIDFELEILRLQVAVLEVAVAKVERARAEFDQVKAEAANWCESWWNYLSCGTCGRLRAQCWNLSVSAANGRLFPLAVGQKVSAKPKMKMAGNICDIGIPTRTMCQLPMDGCFPWQWDRRSFLRVPEKAADWLIAT
eukprot:symbB.v1.2.020630.t1/scaffold1744.1/size103388/5